MGLFRTGCLMVLTSFFVAFAMVLTCFLVALVFFAFFLGAGAFSNGWGSLMGRAGDAFFVSLVVAAFLAGESKQKPKLISSS